MKRILISFMTMALVGALVGGGVYAYFSDTETSAGNTFTAGTLDLTVDGANPWASTKITVANMKPGSSGAVDCTLVNAGNLAGSLTVDIKALVDSQGTCNEPECVNEGGTYSGGACTGNTPVNLSTKMDIVVWVDNGAGGGTANNSVKDGTEQQLFSGTLADADVAVPWTVTGGLGAGTTTYIGISYSIATSVTNEIQGDSSTFTIEFNLEQA
jgi:spore coat-associated protein N